jgi:hypothetical protein
MSDSLDLTDVHVDTLRVQAPEEAAQQVRLRLSTKLAGADLRPPGLAPSQVLLVRSLSDPEPGELDAGTAGAGLDRAWERAVREALDACRRRAVRPSGGRVPPDAEAVLFRDAAEAWACWCRERIATGADALPWWMRSLPSSSDALTGPSGKADAPAGGDGAARSGSPEHSVPDVGGVWRAQPRLVPSILAHLATWGAAADGLRRLSEPEARAVLQSVCAAFDAPMPARDAPPAQPPSESKPPASPERSPRHSSGEPTGEDAPGGEASGEPESAAGDETDRSDAEAVRAPWASFVRSVGGRQGATGGAGTSPAHRELLGVALALHERPASVRSRDFQADWQAWREQAGRPDSPPAEGEPAPPAGRTPDAPSPAEPEPPPGETGDRIADSAPDGRENESHEDAPASRDSGASQAGDESSQRDARSSGDGEPSRGEPDRPDRDAAETPSREPLEGDRFEGEAYAATKLGGVFYLVNVLQALDLPAAAETPPVGEHVGAWAVLDALARTLSGTRSGAPGDESGVLRPNDPAWHVLADLDGRPFGAPAGRALDAALGDAAPAYRMPPAWLDAPPADPPVAGRWCVEDGRLRVWTELGCVADVAATGDPAEQAAEEWNQWPGTGRLRRAESAAAMPRSPEPNACAAALAHWAARATPYVRHRLAAALGRTGPDARSAGWIADLLTADARLYTTDVNVDVVFPLDAARIDARVAGLDRSPGWWPSGGRVVRFHFAENK